MYKRQVSGITDLHIGDTICSVENPESIPFQKISEPTIAMNFMVNDSPLAGQEATFVTSRHIRERLFRELNTDVSLRVEETESPDCFKVSGRGELHLSCLLYTSIKLDYIMIIENNNKKNRKNKRYIKNS